MNNAIKFLQTLFKDGEAVNIRMLQKDPYLPCLNDFVILNGNFTKLQYLIKKHNTDNIYNMYLGAFPRVKNSLKLVSRIGHCFVDIDEQDFETEEKYNYHVADLKGRLSGLGLYPSIEVNSGHGKQFYWILNPDAEKRFTEGLKIAIDKDGESYHICSEWTELQKALIMFCKSDDKIHDPPRVLRLPSTINRKPAKKNKAKEVIKTFPPVKSELININSNIYSYNNFLPILKEYKKTTIKEAKKEEKAKTYYSKFVKNNNPENFKEAVLNTLINYGSGLFSDNKEYFKCLMAFKSEGYSYDAIDPIFQNSDNYDYDQNLRDFEKSKTDRINFGSAYYFAHKANPEYLSECLGNNKIKIGKNTFEIKQAKENIKFPEVEKKEGEQEENFSFRPENIYTQQSDALNFVEEYKDKVKYCHKAKSWYIWQGQRWEKDDTEKINKLIQDYILNLYKKASDIEDKEERIKLIQHSIKAETKKYQTGVLELARCNPLVTILPEQFDRDNLLLNVKNGTFNFETMKLQPHDSKNLITKLININYNPDTLCPVFLQFMDEIFMQDAALIEFFIRVMGYLLTGLTTEQCFFILYGMGQNGKSTIVSLIQYIMNDYQQQIPAGSLMKKNDDNGGAANNDIAKMRGARFVNASELENDKTLSEAVIKRLTGSDVITARFLHQEFFDFIPICKIFLATNYKPQYSADPSINRRIKLVPFNFIIPEEKKDRNIFEKFKKEEEGILNLIISGTGRYLKDGLQEPEAVQEATSSYKSENDLIQRFIDDCCLTGKDMYKASSASLGKGFTAWCAESGEKEVSTDTFFKKLKYRGFLNKRSYLGGRLSRIWVGIALKDISDNKNPYDTYDTYDSKNPIISDTQPHEGNLPETMSHDVTVSYEENEADEVMDFEKDNPF